LVRRVIVPAFMTPPPPAPRSIPSLTAVNVRPYVRAGRLGGSPYTAFPRVARTGRADPHRRRASRDERKRTADEVSKSAR
jgi:hypothetical protein